MVELIVIVVLLIILLIIALAIWITVSLFGLIVTLVIAGIVGWRADKIVPGKLPFGILGAVLAGLVGSWIGGIILDDFGPELGGIELIPALIGAILLAFVVDFFVKRQSTATG